MVLVDDVHQVKVNEMRLPFAVIFVVLSRSLPVFDFSGTKVWTENRNVLVELIVRTMECQRRTYVKMVPGIASLETEEDKKA